MVDAACDGGGKKQINAQCKECGLAADTAMSPCCKPGSPPGRPVKHQDHKPFA